MYVQNVLLKLHDICICMIHDKITFLIEAFTLVIKPLIIELDLLDYGDLTYSLVDECIYYVLIRYSR